MSQLIDYNVYDFLLAIIEGYICSPWLLFLKLLGFLFDENCGFQNGHLINISEPCIQIKWRQDVQNIPPHLPIEWTMS